MLIRWLLIGSLTFGLPSVVVLSSKARSQEAWRECMGKWSESLKEHPEIQWRDLDAREVEQVTRAFDEHASQDTKDRTRTIRHFSLGEYGEHLVFLNGDCILAVATVTRRQLDQILGLKT